MRVAVVLSDLAVPADSGLQEQSLLLIEGLAAAGVELHLFAFSRAPILEAMLPIRLAAPLMPTRTGWTLTGLVTRLIGRDGLERRLKGYDVVYLEGAAAAGLMRRQWAARAVVNLIDPGSRRRMRFARAAIRPLAKLKELFAAGLSFLLEASLNNEKATWVVVSESDRDYLRAVHRHEATIAIPVMLPALPAPIARDEADTAVVTIYADLREPHMFRAFVALARDVLVPSCKAEPRIEIRVLGRLTPAPDLLASLPALPMTFIGRSPDHLGELQRSDIVILPDTIGTGLKNRAVQCLGLGCATIGTAVAFEAIAVRNGVEAFVADTTAEMLDAVLTLARSAVLRRDVGDRAREFAAVRYGSVSVVPTWMNLFRARAGVLDE